MAEQHTSVAGTYTPTSLSGGQLPSTANFAPPPQRQASATQYTDDVSDPVHYTRDPTRLTAYLIPFPKPEFHKGLLHAANGTDIPTRFIIYTPPAPPLSAPKEGEKEDRVRKLQRKWQTEVREAKTSTAKVASWKGVKGRVTKGIDAAMGWTSTSQLDFLNRIPGAASSSSKHDAHDDDETGDAQTKKTVGLEEMVMVYPNTLLGTQEEIRADFINTMLRTKSKAQRDAILATGLLPVTLAIDILATLVWPFGGLFEIDGVWAAKNIRGAKTARSVTKRLGSTTKSSGDASKVASVEDDGAKLRLQFVPSPRVEVLTAYLAAECHKRDPKYFKSSGMPPTETQVLEAIAWSPSHTGGETRNWEDEQWEISEVKEDLRLTIGKGAKEWDSWVKTFEKDPEKALKK